MLEIYKIARGEPTEFKFRNHSEVKQLLNQLHDYYSLSWPQIADLPAINPPGADPIPFSTLVKIAKSGVVPQKWRYRFPGVRAVDNRPRILISKINMISSANSINNHISLDDRIRLVELLQAEIKREQHE